MHWISSEAACCLAAPDLHTQFAGLLGLVDAELPTCPINPIIQSTHIHRTSTTFTPPVHHLSMSIQLRQQVKKSSMHDRACLARQLCTHEQLPCCSPANKQTLMTLLTWLSAYHHHRGRQRTMQCNANPGRLPTPWIARKPSVVSRPSLCCVPVLAVDGGPGRRCVAIKIKWLRTSSGRHLLLAGGTAAGCHGTLVV